MKIGYELSIQISIVLVCFFLLAVNWASSPIKAQGSCGGEPPLSVPGNPKSDAWAPGRTYAVFVVDPATDPEFEQMRDGALAWNSYSAVNCSAVTFGTATRANTAFDPEARVPDYTIWFYRAHNTQFHAQHSYIGGKQEWEVRAAKVAMLHPWGSSTPDSMKKTATHELGHGFGLQNETFPGVEGRTIMGRAWEITSCDTEAIRRVYCPQPTPSPSPTPEPTPEPCIYEQIEAPWDPSGYGELQCDICQDGKDNDCQDGEDWLDHKCLDCWSPMVIDTLGDGFDLTGAQDGVVFDIAGVGTPIRISWTQGDDAWLVLDRNGNGTIDSGRELFGAVTAQPASTQRNGFLALAEFDKHENGGNSDGKIDSQDAIFSSLRLWQDANHNGISEPSELSPLLSLGVASIDLDYRMSGRQDEHGNRFKYRSKVYGVDGAQLGRWAWDVFLVPESLSEQTSLVPKMPIFSFSSSKCQG